MRKTMAAIGWLLILMAGMWIPGSACKASVETELITAIRQKNMPKVQLLLNTGANVNERDEGPEQTPLMWAVQVDDIALVRMLLLHGADVQAQDYAGNTALMLASQQGNYQIVHLLLENGAEVGPQNNAGATAMTLARTKRHLAVVRLLNQPITRQAAIQRQPQSKATPNRSDLSRR